MRHVLLIVVARCAAEAGLKPREWEILRDLTAVLAVSTELSKQVQTVEVSINSLFLGLLKEACDKLDGMRRSVESSTYLKTAEGRSFAHRLRNSLRKVRECDRKAFAVLCA